MLFMNIHEGSPGINGGGPFHERHRVGTEDDLTGARACTGAVVWSYCWICHAVVRISSVYISLYN